MKNFKIISFISSLTQIVAACSQSTFKTQSAAPPRMKQGGGFIPVPERRANQISLWSKDRWCKDFAFAQRDVVILISYPHLKFKLFNRSSLGFWRVSALAEKRVRVRDRSGTAFPGQYVIHRVDHLLAVTALLNLCPIRSGWCCCNLYHRPSLLHSLRALFARHDFYK